MLNTEIFDANDIVSVELDGTVKLLGVPNLIGPADISVFTIEESTYVIIPEHSSGCGDCLPVDDQVTVILLEPVKLEPRQIRRRWWDTS